MNLMIEIPDDNAARYQKIAQSRGLTFERWMLEVAENAAAPLTNAPPKIGSDDSGATLLAVLQNSPYPEIDLAPPRDRVPLQVRDIVL